MTMVEHVAFAALGYIAGGGLGQLALAARAVRDLLHSEVTP